MGQWIPQVGGRAVETATRVRAASAVCVPTP